MRPPRAGLTVVAIAVLAGACVDGSGGSPQAPAAAEASSGDGPVSVPAEAASALLGAERAAFEMTVVREKRPGDPIETLVTGSGQVEPVTGRGAARYDLSGLLELPSSATPPASIVDLAWTRDVVYLRLHDDTDGTWQTRSRAEVRASGGLAGRLPDEVLGLVALVAVSKAEGTAPLDDARIDGAVAARRLVAIPVDSAAREGVPADVPDAAILRAVYGIDELEIEVWLVDGAVRRLRYALARDPAPYGGPDRTEVTYDWLVAPDADPIEVPPAGGDPPAATPRP